MINIKKEFAGNKIKEIIAIWATKNDEINDYEYSKKVKKMGDMMLELISDETYKDNWSKVIEASADPLVIQSKKSL